MGKTTITFRLDTDKKKDLDAIVENLKAYPLMGLMGRVEGTREFVIPLHIMSPKDALKLWGSFTVPEVGATSFSILRNAKQW